MKTYTTILLIAAVCFLNSVYAQQTGVAINTNGNSPHSSAMLDVQSTNKGFLLPRMTQAQRISISNPAEGLLVFDTDAQRLFQYQDGIWRFLIDNSYWAKSATRKWVYNGTDSVGIGTAAPLAKLHVNNGDLRVSNADINVVNGDVVMNKAGGILQFQDASVNTGYLQISGDNLRLGTNVGNSTGNVIIRLNGTERVTVSPDGNVNLSGGRVTSTVTGDVPLTPLCWGLTNSIDAGGIRRGTANVSVSRIAEGQYRIFCNGITANSLIMLTPFASNVNIAAFAQNGFADVYTRSQATGNNIDQLFNFLIY
ncbi:hypothetical protein [Lacibacter sp.]|uniref:hypothetical protein n=1 Tax=Lacibacter sp. TaxID=1915409 RepID=UPI002B4AF5AC|nr:hypothetical protein [Lacibacter sp.]HLP39360.1 hypothetical protein [Lacibacter sp.]